MGWSYAHAAGLTMDKLTAACIESTSSQTAWKDGDKKYFWQSSRVEHADGAITGTVYLFVDWKNPKTGKIEERAHRTGSFRIEPDGVLSRGPKFLRDASVRIDLTNRRRSIRK